MRAKSFAIERVVAAAVLAASAVTLGAQSLGDVAKKEEERRKQLAASGKVYTNKDLAPVPPSSAPPAPTASADTGASKDGDKPSDAKSDSKADSKADGKSADGKAGDDKAGKDGAGDKSGGKKDQAHWADRMKAARGAIDRDSTLADAMQSRLNALATDVVNRDDPAQRAALERERQKASAELDRLKKQIITDRKALSDLEDEARRAGVPPGWLR